MWNWARGWRRGARWHVSCSRRSAGAGELWLESTNRDMEALFGGVGTFGAALLGRTLLHQLREVRLHEDS